MPLGYAVNFRRAGWNGKAKYRIESGAGPDIGVNVAKMQGVMAVTDLARADPYQPTPKAKFMTLPSLKFVGADSSYYPIPILDAQPNGGVLIVHTQESRLDPSDL